ncbi:MAG TPA: 4Fe-4S dicluster domain-containing protein [Thermodesulfobacteriota bacterium]|nr:4Fe-4S dicluster domain-containing protein [Thermodesulfobacteriota bacterium]
MELTRRRFFKISGLMAASSLAGRDSKAHGADAQSIPVDPYGCLVDTTLCIGCRKCEQACNERNRLAAPKYSFEDLSLLDRERRMDETSYTVVNRYQRKEGAPAWDRTPSFVKFQCMHCLDPACVSACIVGALRKQPYGPVTYDVGKCIGCRYCMVACPFQVPAYEYLNPLTPEVRKCNFCFKDTQAGRLPACVQTCPREVITFGKRSELLHLADWKIRTHPGRYQNRIYGAQEVGGTSWLYLASEPFETLGFPKLGLAAPPRLTESIQHSLFQYFSAPLILFAALGGIMGVTSILQRKKNGQEWSPQDKGQEKGREEERTRDSDE